MSDQIIKLGQSLVQHGKNSDRVYLMRLSKADFPDIIEQIDALANTNDYTKIFAKVPVWAVKEFEKKGYRTEAVIPAFFDGKDMACFMAFYPKSSRGKQLDSQKAAQIIEYAQKTQAVFEQPDLPEGFCCEVLSPADTEHMVSVYKRVFETYPFPIFSAAYLKQTMEENIVYFGIRYRNKLIAVSSCEMDVGYRNAEMTDFATLPGYRSKGLASFLLFEMEREMIKRGILTAYTIARALSYGMNITFAKHGYAFSGTLINNTDISGSIESMNVWYKELEHTHHITQA